MTIPEAWQEILTWLEAYIGGKPGILILAVCSAGYLLIANKSVRLKIIIPLLLLVPAVMNPFVYQLQSEDDRYWRYFWLLPDAVLIALAFTDLARRLRSQWLRCAILLASGGLIVLLGTNVFTEATENPFRQADNPQKVQKAVRQICDVILADNPNPKCVFNDWLNTETRQYSGDIIQMYGRDFNGFIIPMDAETWRLANNSWHQSTSKNWMRFFQHVREEEYTHLCLRTDTEQEIDLNLIAQAFGYSVLWKSKSRTVYHLDKSILPPEGVQFFREMRFTSNKWSDWIKPDPGVFNYNIRVGNAVLGDKKEGDRYFCQVEIEFKNVTAIEGKDFFFCSHGAVDNSWTIGNVWNSQLVRLTEAPPDGRYLYSTTQALNQQMTAVTIFDIGFRCDNWASGMFRIRNVTIRKESLSSE